MPSEMEQAVSSDVREECLDAVPATKDPSATSFDPLKRFPDCAGGRRDSGVTIRVASGVEDDRKRDVLG